MGAEVTFDYDAADQDGYLFRASGVSWPHDQPGRDSERTAGPTDGYGSSLSITFDQPEQPGRA